MVKAWVQTILAQIRRTRVSTMRADTPTKAANKPALAYEQIWVPHRGNLVVPLKKIACRPPFPDQPANGFQSLA